MKKYLSKVASLVFAFTLLSCIPAPASAERIAKIETSGIFFKDTLEVHAFDDPYVKGVTCYVTLPKRTLSIEDQTNTSISCRKVGKISGELESRKKIFKQAKSWFIKSLYIDRIYDGKRNVLAYVSYTEKMSGDNASNSVSVVALNK